MIDMSKPVFHLVACCATKLGRPAEARDLYCSQWFTKVRQVIEQRDEPWAILSANYNLVEPDAVLRPYNMTLADKTPAERLRWANLIAVILPGLVYNTTGRFLKDTQVVIWGGRHYHEHLAERLNAQLPLQGLGIGRQLHWLAQALATNVRVCDSAEAGTNAEKVAEPLTEGGQICGINSDLPQDDTGPGHRRAAGSGA